MCVGGEGEGRQECVLAAVHGGGAGVVGDALHVHAPPPVGPDVGAQGDGLGSVGQRVPLLDVELDMCAAQRQCRGVRPVGVRVESRPAEGLAQGGPALVDARQCHLRREHAGEDAGPEAGDPEARALLVGGVEDPDGEARRHTPGLHVSHRGQGTEHAQGAVEGAAVGHGVQVGAGGDPGGPRRRGAPPRPLVACGVHAHVQVQGVRLPGEPVAQCEVLRRPGGAVVAGAGPVGIVADGVDVGEHAREVGRDHRVLGGSRVLGLPEGGQGRACGHVSAPPWWAHRCAGTEPGSRGPPPGDGQEHCGVMGSGAGGVSSDGGRSWSSGSSIRRHGTCVSTQWKRTSTLV